MEFLHHCCLHSPWNLVSANKICTEKSGMKIWTCGSSVCNISFATTLSCYKAVRGCFFARNCVPYSLKGPEKLFIFEKGKNLNSVPEVSKYLRRPKGMSHTTVNLFLVDIVKKTDGNILQIFGFLTRPPSPRLT